MESGRYVPPHLRGREDKENAVTGKNSDKGEGKWDRDFSGSNNYGGWNNSKGGGFSNSGKGKRSGKDNNYKGGKDKDRKEGGFFSGGGKDKGYLLFRLICFEWCYLVRSVN